MAKQPEMRDRFRIFAETSSEAMGPLLAQLTRMGLENIGYELVTDVRRFAGNGERKVHETTSEEFAVAWLKDHPTFQAKELAHHFRDSGRVQGTAYSALRELTYSGVIKKLSPGNYQRADVKAIPPPKTARGKMPPHEITNDALILKMIKRRKRITVVEAGAMLDEEGRNRKSASPIISRYAKAGLLKQVEPGVYDVVQSKLGKFGTKDAPGDVKKKEKDRLRAQARRDAAKAAKLNGQGDTAHG